MRSALTRLAASLIPLAVMVSMPCLPAAIAHAETDIVGLSPDPFIPQGVVGTTNINMLTLTNHGTAAVTVTSAVITQNADRNAYGATVGSCTSSIAPGDSCYVDVLFHPDSYTTYYGTLEISFDALPTRTVYLQGVGGYLAGPVGDLKVTQSFGRNLLSWTPPTQPGDPAASSYLVYRNDNGAMTYIGEVSTSSSTFADTHVTPGESVTYRVVAFNSGGPGEPAEVTAGPSPASGLVVASTGQGGPSALYLIPDGISSPAGERVPLFNDTTPRYAPAVSPDGLKVVWSEESNAQQASQTDLWMMSLDGSIPPHRLTAEMNAESDPAWSPDGKTIAYTSTTSTGVEVHTVPSAGGAARRRTVGYEHPSWLPDSSQLIAGNAAHTGLAVLDAAGKATPIAGSESGSEPVVSPDGTRIAFVLHSTSFDFAATLAVAGGTAKQFNDPADWTGLGWRPDGRTLYGERNSSRGSDGVRQVVEFDPDSLGTFLRVMDPAGDHNPTPVGPRVRLTGFSTYTSRNATISFAGTGATTDCTVDNAAPIACTDHVTLTGLATGTHRLLVRTGVQAATPTSVVAATWTVDTAAPVLTIVTPGRNIGQTNITASVQYRATDAGAGVANYDVRYRRAPDNGGYTSYTSATDMLATRNLSRGVRSNPGQEYCFSVRVRDKLGNLSQWSIDHCADNALDDRSLTASTGWKRLYESANYYNTMTRTSTAGATLSLASVQTRRVTLVVTKCASCGRVDVYLAGVRIGSVSTYSPTTQRNVKIALPLLSTLRAGKFVLKNITSGKNIIIDGVAFGRV